MKIFLSGVLSTFIAICAISTSHGQNAADVVYVPREIREDIDTALERFASNSFGVKHSINFFLQNGKFLTDKDYKVLIKSLEHKDDDIALGVFGTLTRNINLTSKYLEDVLVHLQRHSYKNRTVLRYATEYLVKTSACDRAVLEEMEKYRNSDVGIVRFNAGMCLYKCSNNDTSL